MKMRELAYGNMCLQLTRGIARMAKTMDHAAQESVEVAILPR